MFIAMMLRTIEASAQSVQESSEQSMQEISEIDTEPTDTSAVPDFTLSEDGENVFGGHGPIRPVTVEAGEQYVFQDDEYYYYGGCRLLKSAVSGDDVSYLCEDYSKERCDFYDLIGFGQDMYYVDLNTESAWKGHAGGLKRILSGGTVEDLHPQSKIAADDLNSIACRVTYRDVQRLGDSGIYYVNGSYKSSADEPYNDVYPNPLLLNSRTGEMRTLHLSEYFGDYYFNQYYAEYDEASENLFISGGETKRS